VEFLAYDSQPVPVNVHAEPETVAR
jgi:hypothetical protein